MPPINEELRFNATLKDGFSSDFRKLTTNANAGVGKLSHTLNRFGSVARTATTRLSLFSAATVALGKGVELFISRNAELVDAIGKSAEATGLAIDEYQGLRLEFELSGGSARGFETAMRTLTRAVGDANRGVGQGRLIFEDLGIALKDGSGNIRATAEVLDDLNAALASITSDSERNSILAALVGSRNTTATNLLFQQFAGRRSLVGAAASGVGQTLGGTFTEEQAEIFAAWNDEFTRLNATTDVLFTNISASLAESFIPQLQSLQSALANINRDFDGFIDSVANLGTALVTGLISRSLFGRLLSLGANKGLGRGFSLGHTRDHGNKLSSLDRLIAATAGGKASSATRNLGVAGFVGRQGSLLYILNELFGFGDEIKNTAFGSGGRRGLLPFQRDLGGFSIGQRQYYNQLGPAGMQTVPIDSGTSPIPDVFGLSKVPSNALHAHLMRVRIEDVDEKAAQKLGGAGLVGTQAGENYHLPTGLMPTTTTTPEKSAAQRQKEVFEFQELMGNRSYDASLIADSAGLLAEHSKKAAKIQVVASTAAAIMQQFATPGLWIGLAWINAGIILRLGKEQLKAIDNEQLADIGGAPAAPTTQTQVVNTQAAPLSFQLQLGSGQQGVGDIQGLSDALRTNRGLVDVGGFG